MLVSKERGKVVLTLLDHGLYRDLSANVKMDYAHLWASLIEGDMREASFYCSRLGVNELFPLFVSMLTVRNYDQVTNKKLTVVPTEEELLDVGKNAAIYMNEITEVLSQVSRELLLLFKTNDTLRSIDIKLGVPPVQQLQTQYLLLYRYAKNAIYKEEMEKSPSEFRIFFLEIRHYITEISLVIYSYWIGFPFKFWFLS